MMRSLRTIMAPHTTMTAPSTMSAKISMMAGLVAVVRAVAERMAPVEAAFEAAEATDTDEKDQPVTSD